MIETANPVNWVLSGTTFPANEVNTFETRTNRQRGFKPLASLVTTLAVVAAISQDEILSYDTATASEIPEIIDNQVLTEYKKVVNEVISQIRSKALYEDGWDGPNSLAPIRQAINDAVSFARMIDFSRIHTPFVSLEVDGEINFWWNLDEKIKVDLGFDGSGAYSYYANLAGIEHSVDDVTIDIPLSSEVMKNLKRL